MTLKRALFVVNGALMPLVLITAFVANSRTSVMGVRTDTVNSLLGLVSVLAFGGSTVLVIVLKGRPIIATIAALAFLSVLGAWLGIALGVIGLVDFAKPGSWWARAYYDDELLARAERNFAKRVS